MLLNRLVGLFSHDMGIDLGTANTLVCLVGQGIVLSEPSVVAVKRGTSQVLDNGNAVGNVAKEMMGKTPGSDAAKNKTTYPALLGLAQSKDAALDHVESSLKTLAGFDAHADPLRAIARYLLVRKG